MKAFMYPRDIALFLRSARTDARIETLRSALGSAGALEAVYAEDPDPWASASPHYRYQRRKYEVLTSLLPCPHFDRVLDLGCGPGLLSRHLSDRAGSLLGIDISPTAVANARKLNADRPNAAFAVHDLLDVPNSLDDSFDLVVLADVLYYLSPLDRGILDAVAQRVARLLRAGGVCLLANHYVVSLDPESRRSRRIHDAFGSSGVLEAQTEYRRPFYLATIFRKAVIA